MLKRHRLVVASLLAAAACARQATEKPSPGVDAQARAEASEPVVLAESTNRTPPLGVQVLEARRVAADTLRLEIVVSNLATATAAPPELEAVQTALAAFGRLSLVTADGGRRFFPLHDSAGRMAWSGLEPPAPGQRQRMWVLFPAPAPEGARVTLVVPGLAPVPGIPVSKGS